MAVLPEIFVRKVETEDGIADVALQKSPDKRGRRDLWLYAAFTHDTDDATPLCIWLGTVEQGEAFAAQAQPDTELAALLANGHSDPEGDPARLDQLRNDVAPLANHLFGVDANPVAMVAKRLLEVLEMAGVEGVVISEKGPE